MKFLMFWNTFKSTYLQKGDGQLWKKLGDKPLFFLTIALGFGGFLWTYVDLNSKLKNPEELMSPIKAIERANEQLRNESQVIVLDSSALHSHYYYYFVIDRTIKEDANNLNIKQNSNLILDKIKKLGHEELYYDQKLTPRLESLAMNERMLLYALLRLQDLKTKKFVSNLDLKVCYYTGVKGAQRNTVDFTTIAAFLKLTEPLKSQVHSESDMMDIIQHVKAMPVDSNKRSIVTILSDFDHESLHNNPPHTLASIQSELSSGLNNIYQLNFVQFPCRPDRVQYKAQADSILNATGTTMNTTYIGIMNREFISNLNTNLTDFIDFLLAPTVNNSMPLIFYDEGSLGNIPFAYKSDFTIEAKGQQDKGLILKSNFQAASLELRYKASKHNLTATPIGLYYENTKFINGTLLDTIDAEKRENLFLTVYPLLFDEQHFQKHKIKIEIQKKLSTCAAYALWGLAFAILVCLILILLNLLVVIINQYTKNKLKFISMLLIFASALFLPIIIAFPSMTKNLNSSTTFKLLMLSLLIAIAGLFRLLYHAKQP